MQTRGRKYYYTTDSLQLIGEERFDHTLIHKYTATYDDEHAVGELAMAASVYATPPELRPVELPPPIWPWTDGYKPCVDNRIKELVKAGALILAEIDRLQRLQTAYEDTV